MEFLLAFIAPIGDVILDLFGDDLSVSLHSFRAESVRHKADLLALCFDGRSVLNPLAEDRNHVLIRRGCRDLVVACTVHGFLRIGARQEDMLRAE